ncbi:unnamed protein product [Lupinus luteus]|uniref:Uncharacterized protein n=1 Tax=Lupinus luteus TaxID=3873 RepID=A0AAV1YGV4_LUPLU
MAIAWTGPGDTSAEPGVGVSNGGAATLGGVVSGGGGYTTGGVGFVRGVGGVRVVEVEGGGEKAMVLSEEGGVGDVVGRLKMGEGRKVAVGGGGGEVTVVVQDE